MFLKSCAIKTCKLLVTSPLKWKVTGRLKDTSRLDLGECFFNKCQWNEGEKAAWAHVITGNKADNGEIATQPNKHSDALVRALFPGEWCALRPSPLLGYVLGSAHKTEEQILQGRTLPRHVEFSPFLLLYVSSLATFHSPAFDQFLHLVLTCSVWTGQSSCLSFPQSTLVTLSLALPYPTMCGDAERK